ncbi:Protein kinase domain containing protein [Neofusicoccum parvum]|uniref:Protein kinase domain containing protein n=1 Tax=Neofusicoccum parvum TaxID=310453 RepID=A0ACB5SAP4_9PEZI|nr:Protein kinase domain containing protein [Neofusicoccum parvum]
MTYAAEVEAYTRLENSDAKDCAPKSYGAWKDPLGGTGSPRYLIRLEYLQGQTLAEILPDMSSDDREDIRKLLDACVDKIHAARVSHGNIRRNNIIVAEDRKRVWLVGFGHAGVAGIARLQKWYRNVDIDKMRVGSIFDAANTAEATSNAFILLDNPLDEEMMDDMLLDLLGKMGLPKEEVLTSILDRVWRPSCRLALTVATMLGHHGRRNESVRLLLHCIQDHESRAPPDDVMEMKGEVARHAASWERDMNRTPQCEFRSASTLYKAAADYAARHDGSVWLELRMEWARLLSPRGWHAQAVDVCVMTVDGLGHRSPCVDDDSTTAVDGLTAMLEGLTCAEERRVRAQAEMALRQLQAITGQAEDMEPSAKRVRFS